MKRFASLAIALGAVMAGLTFVLAVGSASATSASPSSTLPTLTLAVTKNTVTVGGDTVSGAVNISTTVSGEAEDNPALILLKPGVTPAEFAAVVSKLGPNSAFDYIDPYATIVFDSQDALKGKTTTAQVVLPAGNYVAVNNGNGFTPFTVTQSASPASLPNPDATVTAIDFGFRGASTLRDGDVVRFQNNGFLIHMFSFAQAKSVADAKKAEALLLLGKAKGATKKYGTGVKGVFAGPLSSGSFQQEVINEPPGVYVIACGMNAQDGREHYELGMFRTIRIVK